MVKCIICGDAIKKSKVKGANTWHHLWRHSHRAIPDSTRRFTQIEKEINKFRNVIIQLIWLLIAGGMLIMVVYLLKILIPLL